MIRIALLFLAIPLMALSQNFDRLYKMNEIPSSANAPGRAEEAVNAIPTSDGGYLVAGHMSTDAGGGYHPYVLKIDGNGDSLWGKIYDYWSNASVFNFYKDANDDFQLAVSALIPGPETKAIILNVDPANGDTISTQTLLKHQNTNSMGQYHDMEILPDGSMILAYRDDAGGTGAQGDVGHTYKINADGTVGWQFEHDGTNATYQVFYDLYWDGTSIIGTGTEVAGSNKYIGEWVVTSLDTAGNVEWTKTIQSPPTGWGYRWFASGSTIAQNSQGQYLVGGGLKFDNPQLPSEGTVITFSATGDSLRTSRIPNSRGITHIIPDGNGDFVATGTGLYVDSMPGFVEYIEKAMVANLSTDGILGSYALRGDSNYYDGGTGKVRYWGNALIPTGGSEYLMVGSGFQNSNGPHQQVTFISKVAAPAVGIQARNIEELQAHVYPNPSSSFLNIQMESPNGYCSFILRDVMGRIHILQDQITNHTTQINVSDLACGVYFLEVRKGELIVARKRVLIQ